MERRSRVLLILLVVIGLAFLLTGCLKKIDVTLTVAIQGLGETDPAVGAHVFKYGTSVTLTATPAEGYNFEKWEVEGLGSFNESVKEIKLKDSILATAFFAKKSFNIEASVDPENGGTVTGAGSYLFGDTASLTAVAAEGFKFVEWTENGAPIGSDNPLEFVVNANRAFVAHFANEYMVTVNVIPEEGGMASGGGKYIFGSEITVVATPADCYDFDGWFVGETLVSEDAEYTFTAEADVDLVAVFTIKTYVVTSTAGENGKVDPEGETVVECGGDLLMSFIPDEGYGVDVVTVDGIPVNVAGSPDTAEKTYSLEDIRDNHAVDVTFKQIFFVTEFDFQGQFLGLGNRYGVHIEVDPEVTLVKFSYPDDDTEVPISEAEVVGGIVDIINFFTLDDADLLLIRAFTADGNLLAEIVVELDYSEAFLRAVTFTPKREWSLPSAVIYDVHIEVSDIVDKVEFVYPGNPEAEPIPATAFPIDTVIDIEMTSVDFNAEEITIDGYSDDELLVSKNFDLLKVIEVSCEFVAEYPILGISEYKFTVVVNSPFCASIEFAADGEIEVIEGNPFAVPDLGIYEFRVFVASELNRVDVMAKDAADDKIAERNIDLPQ